jgi:iron(III) transport system substrate-binding protein
MKQVLPEEDMLEAFYRNLDGRVLSEIGAVVDEVADAVADGSCTVGVTLEAAALEAAEAGKDVALLYPEEGTGAVVDGMAIVAGCAHEENARRFVDFALGADVQRRLSERCWRGPVRGELIREETDIVVLDYDLDCAAAERDAILRQWRELETAW